MTHLIHSRHSCKRVQLKKEYRILQNLNPLEGGVTSFNGSVQILLSMGQREEPRFELRGWKIDLLLHHLDKELGESLCIAHLGGSIILHRPFGKKEGKHPRGSIDGDGNTLLLSTS